MAIKYAITIGEFDQFLNKSFKLTEDMSQAEIYETAQQPRDIAEKFGIAWHESWTIVPVTVIDEDLFVAAMDRINKMQLALSFVKENIKKDSFVDLKTLQIGLDNVFYRLSDIEKLCGVTGLATRESDRIFSNLRQANQRVHELEQQLVEAAKDVDLKSAAANFSSKIKAWWRVCGLGYVREIKLSEHSAKIVLSGHLSSATRLIESSTPVADRQKNKSWFEQLEESGFVLKYGKHADPVVIDCEQSRSALKHIIHQYFPDAKITTIQSKGSHDSDDMTISEIEFYIYDVNKVLALDVEICEDDQY